MKISWDLFWKTQDKSFHEVMRIATSYFARQLEHRLKINAGHHIMDYGCGPGFLADYYAEKNIKISGADINESYLSECRIKHPKNIWIAITTDPTENAVLIKEKLGNNNVDVVVALSIVQYFKDLNQVSDLVGVLSSCTKDGKIVIADIVTDRTSPYKDAAALLLHCVRNLKVLAFIRFIRYVLFSDYSSISKNNKLLAISEVAIKTIAGKHNLNYEIVNGLTIHPSRTSYIFTKK